jgi:hypothetical protein
MNTTNPLNEILQILYSIKDDKVKLEKILQFFKEEVIDDVYGIVGEELSDELVELVPKIAESIDSGLICFLNRETLEIEEVPKTFVEDSEEFEALTGVTADSLNLKYTEWISFITFEPLESNESFQIMEEFTKNLEDKKLQGELFNALNHRRPFANFKDIIENSRYRQDWFDFKKQWLENHINELLLIDIDEEQKKYAKEINGFYDDDGNKIDPESLPVPGLCVICKKHQIDDWDENVLCTLNRLDQRNEADFNCGAFEKIEY